MNKEKKEEILGIAYNAYQLYDKETADMIDGLVEIIDKLEYDKEQLINKLESDIKHNTIDENNMHSFISYSVGMLDGRKSEAKNILNTMKGDS